MVDLKMKPKTIKHLGKKISENLWVLGSVWPISYIQG